MPRKPLGEPPQLSRLRSICFALPEVTERLSHGEPTWFIADKKSFVMFADNHHDDVLACWIGAPEGAKDLLIAEEPKVYFNPPYVGTRGWVGVRLDVFPIDWERLEVLVEDSYRLYAPKRLLVGLD